MKLGNILRKWAWGLRGGTEQTIKCHGCEKPMHPRSYDNLYCSVKCRNRHKTRMYKLRLRNAKENIRKRANQLGIKSPVG
jgi:hypothetical protein